MTDYITKPAADFKQVGRLKRHLEGIDGFIAGGVFKNAFQGEPIKDVDVFFPDQGAWKRARKVLKKRGYKLIYKNARVAAYVDPIEGVRVELIGAPALTEQGFPNEDVTYGPVQETIERFDFTVTKFALWLKSGKAEKVIGEPGFLTLQPEDEPDVWMVTYHPQFFEHLQLRRLVIDAGLVKPFSTFERVLRYTGYGYRLCRESKVILITTLQETDFESEAQLSASFYEGLD